MPERWGSPWREQWRRRTSFAEHHHLRLPEADLKIRGPGDLLGTAQTGLPPLKLGDLIADADLMRQARGAAFVILERDPQLEEPENQPYRRLLAAQPRIALAQVS